MKKNQEELDLQELKNQEAELLELMKKDIARPLSSLTRTELKEWRTKLKEIKTVGDFKTLGMQFRDLFGLSDREALDILHGRKNPFKKA